MSVEVNRPHLSLAGHDTSAARLHLPIERLPLAYIGMDAEFRVLDWNPAAERIFGYSRAEALGQNSIELLVQESQRESLAPILRRIRAGDLEAHSVNENQRKDGRLITCEWFNTPLFDAQGRLTGVIALAQDVTARQQVEDELRHSEFLLAEAQQVAHVGSWNCDVPAGTISWSDEHYRIYGLEPQQLVMTQPEIMSRIHPDDRAAVLRETEEAIRGHSRYDGWLRAVRPDGSIRFVHSRGQVIYDDDGNPVRIYGTTQDVTEQKRIEDSLRRNEALLAEAQELTHVGSWSWDLVTGEVVWSDEQYRIFGLKPQEKVMTEQSIMECIHPDDRALVRARIDQSLLGRDHYEGVIRAVHADGAVRIVHTRGRMVLDDAGRPLRLFGTSQDITERRRAEESLRATEERLAADLAGMTRLQEVSTRLVHGRDPTPLLQDIVDAAIAITDADMGLIQLVDPPSNTLRIVAGRGFEHRFLQFFSTIQPGRNASGLAMAKRQRVIVEDVLTSDLYRGTPAMDVLCEAGARSLQATPLVGRAGQVVGVLSTHYRVPRPPADRDLRVLDLLARQAADWIERTESEEALRRYADRLQFLSRRVVEVQEEERRHLARELHDEIGQVLSAISLNLQSVKGACDPAISADLDESIQIVDRATQQVRNLSLDLRPSMLDDLGLVSTLRWYADRQAQRAGFTLYFSAESLGAALPPDLQITCYRVVQEALTNIVRHAQARAVWLEFSEGAESLELIVRDDGIGFDPAAVRSRAIRGASFGLLGMQERVELLHGALDINSEPGKGTTIKVQMPL